MENHSLYNNMKNYKTPVPSNSTHGLFNNHYSAWHYEMRTTFHVQTIQLPQGCTDYFIHSLLLGIKIFELKF